MANNGQKHRLRTPNEGINQRYLKNWAGVTDKMMPKSLDPFGLDFGDFDQLQLIQGHFVPLQNVWVRVKAFAK